VHLPLTLYGVVRDSTAASLPGASVSVVNQGTGLSREAVTDVSGEFAFTALPSGRYTLRIELQGFKTYVNDSLELLGGQTVRQTFTIEVGQLEETVTVSERSPLVETASAAQKESMLANRGADAAALPAEHHRSLDALYRRHRGIHRPCGRRQHPPERRGRGRDGDHGGRHGRHGQQRDRGLNSYGAQNQISVMSIEAVAEVQVVKGILPAEVRRSSWAAR
jgi:hypothetical protein